VEHNTGKALPEPLHLTGLKLKKAVPRQNISTELLDLTGETSPVISTQELTTEQLLVRIKQSGVYGMGGAGFSTYRKLMAVLTTQITEKHFILNGVECDPGLVHDRWLLENHSLEIYSGVELIRKCVAFTSVTLAVKDTEGLSFPADLKVCKVSGSYPAGAEKILISEILHKTLEHDQLPAEQGILVLNVQTVMAVYEAVNGNKKADTRFITVAELKSQKAKIVKVRLGMKVREVLDAAYPGSKNAYIGGGLMQSHLAEEDAVIDSNVNFIASARLPRYKESPQCSGCGICIRNCPSGLSVKRIADLVDQGKKEATLVYHPELCISCGSCSYSCLAGRNLAMRVKEAKTFVKEIK
jgi:Na+-translocating ferredoxin:NAD+ oxidoreductase RnfC subunit